MKAFDRMIGRGIVVSCQLDENEPLHSPQHCALFAQAAEAGGAVAVRGEGIQNIQEIRATTRLPLIGCTRSTYDDGWLLVTPDMQAVDQLVRLGVDVVALDATNRIRPDGSSGSEFLREVRRRYPDLHILADISTFDEGVEAVVAGATALSTVLCGRTKETYEFALSVTPNLDLVSQLANAVDRPILAEGFIWNPTDAAAAIDSGAYAVIVGGAITRPRVITQLFVSAVEPATAR